MQIHYDGLIRPATYRRGFMRHYAPPKGETIFRLAGMLAVAAGILVLAILGVTEAAFYGMGIIVSLLLALPWLWPSLLAGAAWRRKQRTGVSEKGYCTSQTLVVERHGEEQAVPLADLIKVRVFADMLLLYFTPQAFSILPQELLVQPGQWHQLVSQVLDVVPDHDTLPRKRPWMLAVAYGGILILLGVIVWSASGR